MNAQSLTNSSLLPPDQAGMLPGTAVLPRERRAAMLRGAALIVVALVLIALAVIGLRRFMQDAAPPKRQVARISVLPDKPPPPPPPPKERKEEAPKAQARPQPTPEQQIKPQANEPLKMEGAAGTGPSAFAAGQVTNDYKGGTPTIGGPATTGGNDAARRAQERLYANSVRQMLRDELERQLNADAGELTATFALWVEANGHIGRWEIDERDTALEPRRQAALQAALDKSAERLQLPSPQGLAQPMRFRLTVRAGG